jgi:stage II sporulation protein GA (sporulation sigma-E factor processing peptidase)
VYLDLVMVLNFLVDFLLLLGTNRLSGFPLGSLRCAGGALVGSVYSGACLLPGFRFLGNLLWRCISLSLISMMAFGWNTGALKRGGIFLLLSMAMGGIALSVGRGDVVSLVLCGGLCFLLSAVSFGGQIGGREYVPLKISYEGRDASLIALKDTGNSLRDPVTGEQVLIISAEVASRLTGLTQIQLQNPMETLMVPPMAGLRLIPYRSVGNAGGFLLAKRFADVTIGEKKQSALVAFATEGLGKGEIYQALTGG